ncbi:MAG: Ig-like domain-containing protein [Sphingobium sp.]
MSFEAKITPADKPVAQGAEQIVNGTVTITPGDNIALDIPPEAVRSLTRDGSDLVVELKTGETIRVQNFYLSPDKPSHLFLVDDGKLVSAELGDVASNGVVPVTYVPVGTAANFIEVGEAAAAAGGGLSTGLIIGGLVLGGGAIAAAAGGGGGNDNVTPPAPAPDTTAPVAASGLAINAAGTTLTGSAEANATVRIDTNGDGTPETTVTAGSDGRFTATLNPALTDGQAVTVTVRDAAGNTSPAATVTAPDTTAPPAPTGVAISADGVHVTGTATPGTTIRIDTNGDGIPDATGTTGTNGQFDITLSPPATNGETVSVTARDTAGNTSGPATVTAPDTTAPAAPAGVAISADGVHVTGTSEPRTTIRIDTNGDGIPDATGTTGANGQFDITLSPPATNGETVSVTARDTAGNTSGPATVTAPDTTAPGAPTNVAISDDGTNVTGTAEPGTTVEIDTNGDGIPDATGPVGPGGQFDIPLDPPATNGETISIIVRDPAGNGSDPTTITAPDTTAPAAPTGVAISADGVHVTGTSEPGTTIQIDTNGDGEPDATGTTGPDGLFDVTLDPPVIDGETVTVIAADPAGNESDPVSVIAPDLVPTPLAPILDPSNGSVFTGTADLGTTVTLTTATGVVIGSAAVDADGNWTITPLLPVPNATTVLGTATNSEGEQGPPASVITDSLPPAVPVIDPTNGVELSGTAEAGTTVTLTGTGGAAIGSVVAGSDGAWSFTPATPLADGTVVSATATDATGNVSLPATTTVDAVAPAVPTIEASNGAILTGTAEAGSTVTLTGTGSAVIATVTANPSGGWVFTPTTPLANGTIVTVTATDAVGNVSPSASTTVDAGAPAAPIIDATNGTVLTGTAEAGSTVTLRVGGVVIGTANVDGNGDWSFTPIVPLLNGTVVTGTAADAVGNVGPVGAVTVDAVAPSAPTVEASNGTAFTGTAEAGATVTLSDGPTQLGTTTADANGNWTFTPTTPVANGVTVTVGATDAAGNDSPTASVVVDAIAPAAPTIEPSNGSVLVGTAEAGATVTVTDAAGTVLGNTTANGSGYWELDPPGVIADGTVVNATATDISGNESVPASTTIDGSLPSIPLIDPTDGSPITGSADIGNNILLTFELGGLPLPIPVLLPIVVDGAGRWSFTPLLPLPDGTVIHAVAQNSTGTLSAEATEVVDAVAPAAPVIDPTNGAEISGSAEAGATITLTGSGGTAIGTTTADGSGNWSFTPASPLPNGAVVNATASDPAGNTSPPASAIVDAIAPAAPTIAPTNGAVVSGTAEANATVILTGAGGAAIATVTANGVGAWSYTPTTPLTNGTVVTAVAQDAAGNNSPSATATVDAVAPATPTIAATNGVVLSGTAEAGATITLTGAGGAPIGTTTADGSGNWTFTPVVPLPNGALVTATASDAAGNFSGPVATVVDAIAPAVPVIAPSDGAVLTGTAEAGATITLTGTGGTPIGTTTADGSGNWTFTPASPIANGTVVTAVASDAAGNSSGPATVTVDSVAPAAPVLDASDGSVISGTAEAGATVTLTGAGGAAIGTAVANSFGDFSFSPSPALLNGTVVTATATDATGNVSPPASVTVDTVAPATPSIDPSNGTELSGTAEAGATIVLTDGNAPVGQTTADGSGNWTFTPVLPLVNGTVVAAVAVDASGNSSGPVTVTVDALAPAAPVIEPTNGAELSGTAEAGSTVTLTDGVGNPIGQVTADGSGNWRFTPTLPLANGTVVNATATDAVGNVSPPATTTVDSVAPAAPVIDASNGTEVSGTAEVGSTVTLTDGNGNPIGTAATGVGGAWTFTPVTPLPNGTVVNATATDAAGNVSGPATVTVDAVAPPAPVIDPSNGQVVTGTAEAGATVTLTQFGGLPLGQVTADGSGNWSFTPTLPLPNGFIVTAVATDASGNTSGPAAVTVDAVAPAAPTIAPTNGAALSGTAEAGSTVTLTDGNGNPIGQVVAVGGTWTFLPGSPLPNGTVVNAVASDAAGNDSLPGTTIVDAVAPAAPVIAATNGASLSGTAEAGSTVTLTDGNGNPIGQTVAVGGTWTFTPGSPIPNGTVVNATATDAAGNVSGPGTVTVDATAPSAPVIDPSNGSVLTGTAEAGAIVTLTDGNGNPIGQTIAVGGNWTFTPVLPLTNGLVVNATATDGSGNVSGPASVTVDGIAPPTPVINASNGSVLSGTAEAGATVILTDGNGNPIGQTVAAGGNWTFTPGSPIANGTVVNAVAQDPSGNTSGPASTTVDSIAPPTPVINASNGAVISGTAEAGATIILTDGVGNPIGQTVAVGGNWAFTPVSPLVNGTVINAVAVDAAANSSGPASTTVDTVAPGVPTNLVVAPDGTVLTGTAEPNSQISVVVNGDTLNPVTGNTDGFGNFTVTFVPALVAGQDLLVRAADAAGNVSLPGVAEAPDLQPPLLVVAEVSDGFLNGAEQADGIQVNVGLTAGTDVGDTINVTFTGQGGTTATLSHVVTGADRIAGNVDLTISPSVVLQGPATLVANINGSTSSATTAFTIDTIAPPTPVLSLVANLLTISTEPGTTLTVIVDLGGVFASVEVIADNGGLATLDLLTDLDIGLNFDDLLGASISVSGEDPAGNSTNTASIGFDSGLASIGIGGLALNLSLLPVISLGIAGVTEPGASLAVNVITPLVTVGINPAVDSNGNFAINLLDGTLLSDLGLSVGGLLALGSGLSLELVATDANGVSSGSHLVSLLGSGPLLSLGTVTITGTAGDNILEASNPQVETINGLDGSDYIVNVGTGDTVNGGDGNDTIQVVATNFAHVDGGAGFDTLLLSNGIDINYGSGGAGTWSNIERVDLGTGDSGSVLQLTSAQVDAVTDGANTLQITGDNADVLRVVGALDTGADTQINGHVYDIYSFGVNTLLIEQNTVQVQLV